MRPGAKCRLAALLLGVFMSLQVLAAVPFLHALVHADCNDPTHECGVTLFSHGKVDAAETAVGVVVVSPLMVDSAVVEPRSTVSFDRPLPPGRGPPLAS